MLLAAQLSSATFQRVSSAAVGPPADRKRKSKRPGGGEEGGEGEREEEEGQVEEGVQRLLPVQLRTGQRIIANTARERCNWRVNV